MINRTKIKYALQKFPPRAFFIIILDLWQKIFIKFVNIIDEIRLKNFTTYRPMETSHAGHKFSIFISPQNGFIDKHIYLYGTYEPHILDLIAKYLKKEGTFVDVGANIGQHSMFSASIVGNGGKVYSFEPIPSIYEQLLDSVKINHFESIIETHNVALGEESKPETLYIEINNVGGSSIVGPHGKASEEITINIERGDDMLRDIQHIDMIKIDVEGYEYEVLSGMQKILLQHRPIIILEFSGQLYITKGDKHGDKIISLLENIGYDLYDIEDYMRKITSKNTFLSAFSKDKAQCDILCLPKNKIYEI